MNDSSLKRLIRSKGYTQKQIAQLLGITPASVNAWVTGRSNIGAEYINKLAMLLDVPVQALYSETIWTDDIGQYDEIKRLYDRLPEPAKEHLLVYLRGLVATYAAHHAQRAIYEHMERRHE